MEFNNEFDEMRKLREAAERAKREKRDAERAAEATRLQEEAARLRRGANLLQGKAGAIDMEHKINQIKDQINSELETLGLKSLTSDTPKIKIVGFSKSLGNQCAISLDDLQEEIDPENPFVYIEGETAVYRLNELLVLKDLESPVTRQPFEPKHVKILSDYAAITTNRAAIAGKRKADEDKHKPKF